jgi:copper(I)-binding protein
LVPMIVRNCAAMLGGLACLCSLSLLLVSGRADAQKRREVSAGNLLIVDAWMPQPLQGARAGAIYMGIENHGKDADQLLAAESPIAQHLMVHESRESGGVMKMLPRTGVEIPPYGQVELKPLGMHVMAMGLKSAPRNSGTFPITLIFKRAGRVTVDVVVRSSNVLKPSSQ